MKNIYEKLLHPEDQQLYYKHGYVPIRLKGGYGLITRILYNTKNYLDPLSIPYKFYFYNKTQYDFFKQYTDSTGYDCDIENENIFSFSDEHRYYEYQINYNPLCSNRDKESIILLHHKQEEVPDFYQYNLSHRILSSRNFLEIYNIFKNDYKTVLSIGEQGDSLGMIPRYTSNSFIDLINITSLSQFIFCELAIMQLVANAVHTPYFIITCDDSINLRGSASETWNIRSQHLCLRSIGKSDNNSHARLDDIFDKHKDDILNRIRCLYDIQKQRIHQIEDCSESIYLDETGILDTIKYLEKYDLIHKYSDKGGIKFSYQIPIDDQTIFDRQLVMDLIRSYNYCCHFSKEINWMCHKYKKLQIGNGIVTLDKPGYSLNNIEPFNVQICFRRDRKNWQTQDNVHWMTILD